MPENTEQIAKLKADLNRSNQRARTAEARAETLLIRAENAESVVRAHQTSIGVIGQILPFAFNDRMVRHNIRTGNFNYFKKKFVHYLNKIIRITDSPAI